MQDYKNKITLALKANPKDRMNLPLRLLVFSLLSVALMTSCEPTFLPYYPTTETRVVWKSGEEGYHTYRIPVVLATGPDTVLAFAEGRKGGRGDAGDIDLLVKRSTDGGQTWGAPIVIWDDSTNTCGNPAPVLDEETGDIHLLMTWNKGSDTEGEIMAGTSEEPRRVFHSRSTDGGLTWSTPRDISETARHPEWRWYATGPVHGIQMQNGPFEGRLVIPANHSTPAEERDPATYRSHIVYSDDNGATWKRGGVHEPYTNESTVVELLDGRLMQNMRSYHGQNQRAVSTSIDGGATWTPAALDSTLIEPVCQASLLRYSWPTEAYPKGILLFSNPASHQREKMTIKASFDEGVTWAAEHEVYEGSSAYSSLVNLADGRIGLLFERNDYSEIVLWSSAPFWE